MDQYKIEWLASRLRGRWIVIEGVDGCGKTTLVQGLTQTFVPFAPVHKPRDPGGTPIGEAIRELLLGTEHGMCEQTETLLFMASRMQLLRDVIHPRMKMGDIVICDRWIPSTIAYQGWGGQIGAPNVVMLHEAILPTAAVSNYPDLTILLTVDPMIAAARLDDRPGQKDRMEQQSVEFRDRVACGYGYVGARSYPSMAGKRLDTLEADRPAEDVLKSALDLLYLRFMT